MGYMLLFSVTPPKHSIVLKITGILLNCTLFDLIANVLELFMQIWCYEN